MPTAEAFQAATSIAAAAAHKRQLELEKGDKVTRRERADILRSMSASIQACANVGYRIKQGITPPNDMIGLAMQQPDALQQEITAAAEHSPDLAHQVATAAGFENLAAALATAAAAATSAPPHQSPDEATAAAEPEKCAAALPPVDTVATSSPPLLEHQNAHQVETAATTAATTATAAPGRGRPSDYTDAEADTICAWIQSGKSLNSYCKQHGRKASTIYGWMRESVYFRDNYAQAHEDRADTLVEDMLDIADATEKAVDIIQVMAGKLRIETRKWIAERMRPTKYGNKVTVDHAATVTFNLGVPQRDKQQIIDINPVQARLDKA